METPVQPSSRNNGKPTVRSRPHNIVSERYPSRQETVAFTLSPHRNNRRAVVKEPKDALLPIEQLLELAGEQPVLFRDDGTRFRLTPSADPLPGPRHLRLVDGQEPEERELPAHLWVELGMHTL